MTEHHPADSGNERQKSIDIATGVFASADSLLNKIGTFTRDEDGSESWSLDLSDTDLEAVRPRFYTTGERTPDAISIAIISELASVDGLNEVSPAYSNLVVTITSGPIETDYFVRTEADSTKIDFDKEVNILDKRALETAEDVRLADESTMRARKMINATDVNSFLEGFVAPEASVADAILLRDILEVVREMRSL